MTSILIKRISETAFGLEIHRAGEERINRVERMKRSYCASVSP